MNKRQLSYFLQRRRQKRQDDSGGDNGGGVTPPDPATGNRFMESGDARQLEDGSYRNLE